MEGEALQSSSFNCNICLDSVSEPVVTVCGHLYCWPCIYEWLHRDHPATGPTCPTCKSPMSDTSLVPLYGQDSGTSKTGSTPNRSSLTNCTRSREVEDHPGTSNSNSNYNTWIDDGHFRNYCGLAGLAVGLKYECPYRRLDEQGTMRGIWISIWLRLLLSGLLVFVVNCILWF